MLDARLAEAELVQIASCSQDKLSTCLDSMQSGTQCERLSCCCAYIAPHAGQQVFALGPGS